MHERRRSERQHREARKYKTPHRIIIIVQATISSRSPRSFFIGIGASGAAESATNKPTKMNVADIGQRSHHLQPYHYDDMCVVPVGLGSVFIATTNIWRLWKMYVNTAKCTSAVVSQMGSLAYRPIRPDSRFSLLTSVVWMVIRKPVDPRELFGFFSGSR